MNYKIKTFREENYFILYDLNDNIICYYDNFNELSTVINYSLRDLIREYNREKSNIRIIVINNKKYKLATFC